MLIVKTANRTKWTCEK